MGREPSVPFLIRQGYKIIARNYWTREGEIDIIAQIDNKISFIEVKTRTCGEDSAERSFDKNKKLKCLKQLNSIAKQRNYRLKK